MSTNTSSICSCFAPGFTHIETTSCGALLARRRTMAIKEYVPGTAFPGVIGRTISESEPAWPAPIRAKPGAPNVVVIVLDDTGFGQLGCYGSPIRTPNIDRLAAGGLLFNNMHTTALCSPSRVVHSRPGATTTRTGWRASRRARLVFRAATASFLSRMVSYRRFSAPAATTRSPSANGT